MNKLSTYVHKIHNGGVAVRFDEIRAAKGDDAAIEYAARLLGPGSDKAKAKMVRLAAEDKKATS